MGGRNPRRGGATATEALLAMGLGLALIALAIEAFRFFSLRTAGGVERSEAAREAALLAERLRRVLRFPVRVTPTAAGLLVAHHLPDGHGGVRMAETLFEAGRPGVLTVVDPEGGTREFVLDETGESRVDPQLDLRDGTLVVLLPGARPPFPSEIVVKPLGRSAEGTLGEDPDPGASWLTPEGAAGFGEVSGPERRQTSGHLAPGSVPTAEVAPGAGSIRDGLDLEVAVLAVESRAAGRVLLPPIPPPRLPISSFLDVFERLQAGGLDPALAREIATRIRIWEEALRAGDRRSAARSIAEAEALLRTRGPAGVAPLDVFVAVSETARVLAQDPPDLPGTAVPAPDDTLRDPPGLYDTPAEKVPALADPLPPADRTPTDPLAGSEPDELGPGTGEAEGPPLAPADVPAPGQPIPGLPDSQGTGNPAGIAPPPSGPGVSTIDVQQDGTVDIPPEVITAIQMLANSGTLEVSRQRGGSTTPLAYWNKSGGNDQGTVMGRPWDPNSDPAPSNIPAQVGDRIVVKATGDFLQILQASGYADKVIRIK